MTSPELNEISQHQHCPDASMRLVEFDCHRFLNKENETLFACLTLDTMGLTGKHLE